MKVKMTLISLASVLALASTLNASGGTISSEELSLRKADVFKESVVKPKPVEYTKAAPGTSKKFERSYENAPPLIPHSVEGLLPITKNNNSCLGCHMPNVAKSMGATPIPESHFVNFRPITKLAKDGAIVKEGKKINNTSDILTVAHKQKKLYQGRYNCSQCHVPQANVKPLVKNNFQPEFTSKDLKKKSNLLDVINQGVDVK